MGATYGNISVNRADREALLGWLKSRGISAFVGPAENGWIAFSDEDTDRQDVRWTQSLARDLTRDLDCVAIAVAVYDEEQLYLLVAKSGQLESRYRSCPGMEMEHPSDDDMRPRIEDGPAFVQALSGAIQLDDLISVLGIGGEPNDPLDLHEELAAFLGLPMYTVGFGYRYTIDDHVSLEEAGFTEV